MKRMKHTLWTLALAAALVLCLGAPAFAAAAPDPLPPVEDALAQMSDAARAQIGAAAAAATATAEEAPSGEPAGSDEKALPLVPGVYEGSDGSVLTVAEDGSCTYETLVSGAVNGRAMSGRLTFHGAVEGGEFSFTKVTFYGLDLTKIAENAGYTDASYWETAAGIIYAGAFE